jgi:hypothetical protein
MFYLHSRSADLRYRNVYKHSLYQDSKTQAKTKNKKKRIVS